MLFNSFPFLLVFLPVAILLHALLRQTAGTRAAQAWLLIASVVFYSYSSFATLPLLLGSIVFNWAAARLMMAAPEGPRRKLILQAALTANIVFLCVCKYSHFLLGMLPVGHLTVPAWRLPLGVSFFTLIQVMYLVDAYQGLNGANSLFDHATLVALFPYVVSGPLVRSRAIVPQFQTYTLKTTRTEAACRGLYVFAIGLAKKVIFADAFASIADAGYRSIGSLSTVEAWICVLAYTFELYFDFSGYSDMALGSALMLGIEIPQNFNAPFRAKSVTEFWQRWHISLTNFITNYLYTPMIRAAGKATLTASVGATILAMAIAGLWHGPAWTFGVFGLLHGLGLALNQVWRKKKLTPVPDWLALPLTFAFVNLTLVFFRSPDIPAALQMLARLVPAGSIAGYSVLGKVLPLTPTLLFRPAIVGALLAFFFRSSAELTKAFQPLRLTAAATALLFLLAFFWMNSAPAKVFIYFAF